MKSFLVWLCLILLGTGIAHAHTDYKSSDPAKGALLEVAPSQLTLNFTEALETRFSVFKVYRLDEAAVAPGEQDATSPTSEEEHTHDADEANDDYDENEKNDGNESETKEIGDAATIEQMELLRLNGLAGSLVAEVIGERGDEDEEVRADAGVATTDARTETVSLNLKPDLEAGTYVVMWRVLGTDTHTTQGYYVFQVAPSIP